MMSSTENEGRLTLVYSPVIELGSMEEEAACIEGVCVGERRVVDLDKEPRQRATGLEAIGGERRVTRSDICCKGEIRTELERSKDLIRSLRGGWDWLSEGIWVGSWS